MATEPHERVWVVEWEASMYGMPDEVVWDGPHAQTRLRAAERTGYTVHGPFVLAGAGWHVSPAPNTAETHRKMGAS